MYIHMFSLPQEAMIEMEKYPTIYVTRTYTICVLQQCIQLPWSSEFP